MKRYYDLALHPDDAVEQILASDDIRRLRSGGLERAGRVLLGRAHADGSTLILYGRLNRAHRQPRLGAHLVVQIEPTALGSRFYLEPFAGVWSCGDLLLMALAGVSCAIIGAQGGYWVAWPLAALYASAVFSVWAQERRSVRQAHDALVTTMQWIWSSLVEGGARHEDRTRRPRRRGSR